MLESPSSKTPLKFGPKKLAAQSVVPAPNPVALKPLLDGLDPLEQAEKLAPPAAQALELPSSRAAEAPTPTAASKASFGPVSLPLRTNASRAS
ncbi:protein of unknown function [Caballeronia sp. S22]